MNTDKQLQQSSEYGGEIAPDLDLEGLKRIRKASLHAEKGRRDERLVMGDDGEYLPDEHLTDERNQLLASERKIAIAMLTTFPVSAFFSLNFLTQGRGFEAVVAVLAPIVATGLARNRLLYKAEDIDADLLGIPKRSKQHWSLRMLSDWMNSILGEVSE